MSESDTSCPNNYDASGNSYQTVSPQQITTTTTVSVPYSEGGGS